MAATYTEVTLEDMDRFLKRAFRSMRPRKGHDRGETYYDLEITEVAFIRVWTSIGEGKTKGAEKDKDTIRVQIRSKKGKYSKAPIVKRTQNWRSALQNRIEDALEKYEDEEAYWEGDRREKTEPEGAVRPPPPDGVIGPPPSDKQVELVMRLIQSTPANFNWGQYGFRDAPNEEGVRSLSAKSVSSLIDALKSASPEPEPEAKPQSTGTATFTKLRSGDWGLRGKGLVEGQMVTVYRRDGSKALVQVGRVIWKGGDGTSVAEIVRSGRFAAEVDGEPDYYYGELPD